MIQPNQRAAEKKNISCRQFHAMRRLTSIRRFTTSSLVSLLLVFVPVANADDGPDLAVVHKIKQEAFRNSQVMQHLLHLSDEIGPRVAGSPAYRRAARWSVAQLELWGVNNAKLEAFGEFGRGWSLEHYSGHMTKPTFASLPGIPGAWSGSTDGEITATVSSAYLYPSLAAQENDRWDLNNVLATINAYKKQHSGKLRGKIIMLDLPRDLDLPVEVEGRRYTSEDLTQSAVAPAPLAALDYEWPLTSVPADKKERSRFYAWLPIEVTAEYWERQRQVRMQLYTFFRDEGVLAVLETDRRGTGGTSFMESRGSWTVGAAIPPPMIVLAPEVYARMARLIAKNIEVEVALNVRSTFHESDPAGYNVIADIKGSDRKRRDEVVMVGAHLDSWHGATGATDNAAGSAVMLEVLRILKALDLPLKRSVRLGLWGAEEQGLYGSRGYVRKHFGDPVTMQLKPAHAKLSGYFNLDNGSGKIRGVYLQGNDMMRPIFASWLTPFHDLEANTVSIRNTFGTDHLAFDSLGLPGFQFIQDPLDYASRTHHSDVDDVAHVQASDLMQAAAIITSMVYETANRDDMLPRKPLPLPLPPKRAVTLPGLNP